MTKCILIVEDEPDFQTLLKYHLSDLECEVRVAGNFSEAMLEVARARPDLVLMDIMLPDVDGLSLCEALKAQPALVDASVWMISAAHSTVIRDIARAAGATEFFSKPLDLPALKTRLQEWLGARPAAA